MKRKVKVAPKSIFANSGNEAIKMALFDKSGKNPVVIVMEKIVSWTYLTDRTHPTIANWMASRTPRTVKFFVCLWDIGD